MFLHPNNVLFTAKGKKRKHSTNRCAVALLHESNNKFRSRTKLHKHYNVMKTNYKNTLKYYIYYEKKNQINRKIIVVGDTFYERTRTTIPYTLGNRSRTYTEKTWWIGFAGLPPPPLPHTLVPAPWRHRSFVSRVLTLANRTGRSAAAIRDDIRANAREKKMHSTLAGSYRRVGITELSTKGRGNASFSPEASSCSC